jgi:membrane associated rhomboid family serine protease
MPARRFPLVTALIIAANLIVWIFYELPHLNSSIAQSSFYPCDMSGSCNAPLPWELSWFTSMFMHGGWSHILGNMWFLAVFGKNVEDAFGHLRYLALYIAGGLVAAMTQAAVTLIAGTAGDATVPVLGASGAIAAVLGAYWVLYPNARILTLVLVFPVRIRASIFLGLWFVFQVIEAHSGVTSAASGGTALFAHIGGFVFGVFAAVLLVRSRQREGRQTGSPRFGYATGGASR